MRNSVRFPALQLGHGPENKQKKDGDSESEGKILFFCFPTNLKTTSKLFSPELLVWSTGGRWSSSSSTTADRITTSATEEAVVLLILLWRIQQKIAVVVLNVGHFSNNSNSFRNHRRRPSVVVWWRRRRIVVLLQLVVLLLLLRWRWLDGHRKRTPQRQLWSRCLLLKYLDIGVYLLVRFRFMYVF